jgi:hypothetical protein
MAESSAAGKSPGQMEVSTYVMIAANKEDQRMSQEYIMSGDYNERINEANDIDLDDVVLDQNAVKEWVEVLAKQGLNPGEIMPKARARWHPDTKDLYLAVPVKAGEDGNMRHLVFVLQDEYWKVNYEGRVIQ